MAEFLSSLASPLMTMHHLLMVHLTLFSLLLPSTISINCFLGEYKYTPPNSATEMCTSTCPSVGYYVLTTRCQPCPASCVTCDGNGQCLSYCETLQLRPEWNALKSATTQKYCYHIPVNKPDVCNKYKVRLTLSGVEQLCSYDPVTNGCLPSKGYQKELPAKYINTVADRFCCGNCTMCTFDVFNVFLFLFLVFFLLHFTIILLLLQIDCKYCSLHILDILT